jgi:NADPH:quinone reductase-like Zn-dependent oxidoreductase
MVKKLGADVVIDYTKGDPLDQAKAHGPYDIIVDCAGGYPARQCRGLLGPMGRHVMVAGDTPLAMTQIFVPPFTSRTILGKPTRKRLSAVVDAVAAGHLEVQIAERFKLEEVGKAHELSETHRMTGKIVLLP